MNWKILILVILLGCGAYQHRSVIHVAGEIAPNEPVQTSTNVANIRLNDFTLSLLANYDIEARVLSTEDYHAGTEA